MEKTLKKKVEKKEAPKPNVQLEAVEQLTKVNVNLVQQIQQLSADMDNLKDKVAQVASRLGL